MSYILESVYASGGDILMPVVELNSPAWAQPIVLCADYVSHNIRTEDGRNLVTQPVAMSVTMPKRDKSGAQNITLRMDGVRSEATFLLRAAQKNRDEISMTLRVYLHSDLSEPSETPYYMIVRSYSAQANHVEVTAGLFDMIDFKWPRVVYDSQTAPCLRFITS